MRVGGGVGDVGPAVVDLAAVEALLPLGVGDDAGEQVERARDLLGIRRVVPPQDELVQVDDRPADRLVGLGRGAGQDAGLDAREQPAIRGLEGEIARG